jgi:membrane protease YdiL (CAAX protease family)
MLESYLFLFMSLAAARFYRKVSFSVLIVSLVLALYHNILQPIGLCWVLLLFLFAHFAFGHYKKAVRFSGKALFIVLVFVLSFHKLDGFQNWQIIPPMILSPDSYSYSLWFNYDSLLVILAFLLCKRDLSFKNLTLLRDMKSWMTLGIMLLVVGICAYFLNFVVSDPKVPQFIGLWAFVNLITCFGEELFYRGLLQEEATKIFKSQGIPVVAILLTSLIFGFRHYFIGGGILLLLSFIASLFYGYIYFKTKNILDAVAFHFILNLTHLLLFTYPCLRSVGA